MSDQRTFRPFTAALLAAVFLLPFGIQWLLSATEPAAAVLEVKHPVENIAASPLAFEQGRLGPVPKYPGLITNVQIVDFDGNKLPDVIACDAQRGQVIWYRQVANGKWEEIPLNTDRLFSAPGRATVVDLDKDGDNDVLVSVLGSYTPSDEHIGLAVWLENDGSNRFRSHVLVRDVGRVTDMRAGDLDGDGDLDLVVAVFGHYRGKLMWLENHGGGRFEDDDLFLMPGAIHAPLVDLDDDGDLDVVALFSQDEESVYAFENLGRGAFGKPRALFSSTNFDLGTAGLEPCDLDRDGKTDFLLIAGDNLELHTNYPQPWHGCYWMRNRGEGTFETKRIAKLGGAYSAATGDIDGDGDLDVALVSMFNNWRRKDATSVVWLENDGRQNFKKWKVASQPIQLATVASGDLDGDGRAEIIAGSFHVVAPFDRFGRLTTWSPSKAKREEP